MTGRELIQKIIEIGAEDMEVFVGAEGYVNSLETLHAGLFSISYGENTEIEPNAKLLLCDGCYYEDAIFYRN